MKELQLESIKYYKEVKMNYYEEIKDKLIDVEIQNKVKDYSKNKYTLEKYYEIGKLLIDAQGGEARAKYGESLIKEYSRKLQLELNKKYTDRYLRSMRQFYLMIDEEIWKRAASKLSWSHFLELLRLKNNEQIQYYINKCINYNISRDNLKKLLKSKEYERLPEETKNKLVNNEEITINDLIPNPIIIKNNTNKEIVKEKALQQLILDDIPFFLEQLGRGFTFIKNEYPIKMGDNYNYIDLLLFNIEFNCYVVVELKLNELKKEDIGQVMTYVTYIDKNLRKEIHQATIGMIISRRNNKYIISYCTNPNIIFKEYLLV